MKMGWVVCAAFYLASGIPIAAQTAAVAKAMSPLEQAVIANEKSLIEAQKKKDAEFFKRAVADDFSRVGVDGELHQGPDGLDELKDDVVDLTAYNFKVVSAGDGAAIVTYDLIVQVPAAEDQGPPPRYQHLSSVWVKQGDGWKLKFQQATATHWGDW